MERVNCNKRRRYYRAQDREILINEIERLYHQGFSQNDISLKLDIPRGTISRWMVQSTIKCREPGEAGKIKSRKYGYNENYFSKIDSPNKAYVLGFILGDGCVCDEGKRKRWKIDLAQSDSQILYDIANELNVKELVRVRKPNNDNEQAKVSLTINCTEMCNDLIRLGVIPKKTKREKWISLANNELQWAFIRGYFDADGHVSVVKYRKRVQLSPRFKVTSTYEFLSSLLTYLKNNNIALNVHSIYKKKGCYELSIAKKSDLLAIYRLLYKHGDLYLKRKYDIFSSIYFSDDKV